MSLKYREVLCSAEKNRSVHISYSVFTAGGNHMSGYEVPQQLGDL